MCMYVQKIDLSIDILCSAPGADPLETDTVKVAVCLDQILA